MSMFMFMFMIANVEGVTKPVMEMYGTKGNNGN